MNTRHHTRICGMVLIVLMGMVAPSSRAQDNPDNPGLAANPGLPPIPSAAPVAGNAPASADGSEDAGNDDDFDNFDEPLDPGAVPAPPAIAPQFDPKFPFGPPQTPAPIVPATIPQNAPVGGGASTLPNLPSEEAFDFFQPGYQWKDEDDSNAKPLPLEPEVDPNAGKKKAVVEGPSFIWHNFRNQHLPHTIYKKQYRPENRHLPVAVYEQELDAYTFAAAARNDLRSLRALIDGGRDIHMINGYGETLLTVAAKYNAHDTTRYLLAKGLHPGTAHAERSDEQTRVALRAAEGRGQGGMWFGR